MNSMKSEKSTIRTAVIILILAAVVLAASCSNDDPNPMGSLSLTTPRVTGLFLTDPHMSITGIWGRPTGEPAVYPNPCTGQTMVLKEIYQPCRARVWLAPAVGPLDDPTRVQNRLGAVTAARSGKPLAVIFDDTIPQPFQYIAALIEATDDQGNDLPSGFYRLYITLNDSLTWSDMLIVHDPEEVDRFLLESMYPPRPTTY